MELSRQQLRQGEPEQAALSLTSDNSFKGIDLMRVDQCEEIGETEGPPLAGAAPVPGEVDGGGGTLVNVSIQQEAKVVNEVVPVKRRRGRPPRGQAKTPPQPRLQQPPLPRTEDEEEDVCFICFDGGSLVLCDRRGCPKAYHPACIKRDEAFFQTKAKWNCGWHICSKCQKASSYMCYTCTYSVCKKCIKDEDYVGVRGNMGFCAICMKTIMLIENVTQADKEMVKVDFDDKTSWEYLFKVYWLCLKEKLSLTIDELTKAKNPWKEACNMTSKVESRYTPSDHSNPGAYSSDNSYVEVAANGTKRRRTNDPPTSISKLDTKTMGNYREVLPEGTNWATKELLEFVSYMKNGDMSVLSQFDVQALLLEYIKRKNLRDPRQKSQVVCDSMLVKLFGKQRVGHFEMLKLLESHFLIQENYSDAKTINGENTRAVPCHMEDDGVYDAAGIDRRRKTRKKADSHSPNANMNEYAAIDIHNINLIYLRRNFFETLVNDINQVHEKLVGTIVRIRVSGSDLKLDIYRLVQVVGTHKAKESYQIGTKTTDIMLEVLNLDKREFISINEISDQDLTEDECKRLRQSIKCGLNKRLTVGEVLEKSATLQAMRVCHVLEAEILKLNHLRDRASEKGHRKELRECIEKLETLKSPEERQRRMQEIPKIHTDPSMDPSLASAEDAELATRKLDKHIKGQSSSNFRTQNKGDFLNSSGNSAQKNIAGALLRSRNVSTTFCADKDANSSDQEPTKDEEVNEIWHYQDPTGKTQGPFSMSQLRRWKSSGHFPPYLRIWRTHEKQEQSVLLTDALEGRFHRASTSQNDTLPFQELKLAVKDASQVGNNSEAESDKGNNALLKSPVANNASSSPYSHAVPTSVNNANERQVESLASCFGILEGDNCFHFQPQVSCPQSSSASTGHATANDARETLGTDRWNAVQTDGNHSSDKNAEDTTNVCSVSLNAPLHAPNLNQEINFPDHSSPTPKSSPEDLETQAAVTIQSLASCVLAKGASGVTWSTTTTTTSVVVSEEQLASVTPEDVIAAPSEKPAELSTDRVGTQTQDNPQVTHSTGWQAIIADPDECDESVSDLLAEAEAMESMNGPPSSPTSTFHCDDDDDDLIKGSENDCFNPVARVTLAPCGSDASHASIFDAQNVSDRRNSTVMEAKEQTNSDNQCGAGPELHLFASPAPSPTSQDLTLTTTALRLGSEATESNLEAGGKSKLAFGLFSEPSPRSGHGSARGNANVGAGHRSPRGSQQQRHSSNDRSTGHRDRDYPGRDSGYGRERQWWNNSSSNHNYSNSNHHTNRQWPYGGSHGHGHGHGHGQGAGSYPAHPPKGLRICKFYEGGYCKKGASCSFWHP